MEQHFQLDSGCIVYTCNRTAHVGIAVTGVQITVYLTAKVVFYHISHQLEQHFVNHDCFTKIVTNACKIVYCDTFPRSTDDICIQKPSEMNTHAEVLFTDRHLNNVSDRTSVHICDAGDTVQPIIDFTNPYIESRDYQAG